jgi:hypothetical protein
MTCHEGAGRIEVYLYSFFNLGALSGVVGQRHAPVALPPGNSSGTHCTGGWMVLGAHLGGCSESYPLPRFELRTVQPVASRCTDCALQAAPYIL